MARLCTNINIVYHYMVSYQFNDSKKIKTGLLAVLDRYVKEDDLIKTTKISAYKTTKIKEDN